MHPLGDISKLNSEQKMKLIGALNYKMRNTNIIKNGYQNSHYTWRVYHKIKLWSSFTKSKLQGSTIDFATDLGTLPTMTVYPPEGYAKDKFEEKAKKQQIFEQARKTMYKRPKMAMA